MTARNVLVIWDVLRSYRTLERVDANLFESNAQFFIDCIRCNTYARGRNAELVQSAANSLHAGSNMTW